MTRQTIEVVVDPAGGIKIDALGFTGADCEKATAFLEKALGCVTQTTKKPEYYRPVVNNRSQRVGR